MGYQTVDEQGGSSVRSEQGDGSGNVRGMYGYKDAQGLYRLVEYTAGQAGFQASVKTNEPGVEGKENPADVAMNVQQTPAGIQGRYNQPAWGTGSYGSGGSRISGSYGSGAAGVGSRVTGGYGPNFARGIGGGSGIGAGGATGVGSGVGVGGGYGPGSSGIGAIGGAGGMGGGYGSGAVGSAGGRAGGVGGGLGGAKGTPFQTAPGGGMIRPGGVSGVGGPGGLSGVGGPGGLSGVSGPGGLSGVGGHGVGTSFSGIPRSGAGKSAY